MNRYSANIALLLQAAAALGLCFVACGLSLAQAEQGADKVAEYDVVVYGGTSGGVAAAVQTARMGKSVVVIEPGKHLGGLSSGGLGATDIGNKAAIGGISREFYQLIRKHYEDPAAWKWQPGGKPPAEDSMWKFEPHVAEKVFEGWVAEYKIPVVRGERLNRKDGVKKEGARITSIAMESGRVFKGKRFIDATYEGDLMAAAGVKYHIGREAVADYDESLNGVQVRNARAHQFIVPVDPYVVPGDKSSGVIFGVDPTGPGEEGSGDRRVQAYNLRICATDHPENRLPWPKPKNYDEKKYELLLRNIEAGDERIPWNPVGMPNRKTDSNNNFAVSTDFMGQNYDYPDGDYETREKIYQAHLEYHQGLFWTLANHPRSSQKLRSYFSNWGLSKDEFADNGHWPHQMYVREARRMISDYVMTQHDCQGRRKCSDPVGLGAYNMDSHNVQRYITPEGHVRNEGDIQVGVSPYPISYRSIVPKQSECDNLFVPVALSATHISYGSIRMEPVFMALGQTAATAACQSIDADVPVQKLAYEPLRERLLADKQVIEWTGPVRGQSGVPASLDPKKLAGVVIDDEQAKKTGLWVEGTTVGPFVGASYLHDNDEAKGEKSVAFSVRVPQPGLYEVRIAYQPHANRATNARVTIAHAGGKEQKTVNQRQSPQIDNLFLSLGKFRFEGKDGEEVVVSNDGADGHVIADAVQLLPAE